MTDRTDTAPEAPPAAALHAGFLALLPQLRAGAEYVYRHRRGTGRDDTLRCRCCPPVATKPAPSPWHHGLGSGSHLSRPLFSPGTSPNPHTPHPGRPGRGGSPTPGGRPR
jgi:hypothetical protein